MSDPVTNVEIEDVLSSIRRLISENDRTPRQAAAEAVKPVAEEPQEADPSEDALVLTPALRVAEVAAEAVEKTQEDAVKEALHAPHDHAWEDAGATFDPQENVEDLPNAPEERSEADDVAAQIAEELADSGFDPMEGVSLERAREIDSRIVHWDKMKEVPEEAEYEPDAPGDSAYAGTDVDPLEWQDDEATAEAEVAEETVDEAPEERSRARIVRSESFVAPEAAAEDVVYEDDMAPEEALAGLAGRIEADLRDRLPEQIEAEVMPQEALGDFSEDDAVELDEAILRDMVADIVRQELQGALGERITRNVRKLVRREIHRALAAHELD